MVQKHLRLIAPLLVIVMASLASFGGQVSGHASSLKPAKDQPTQSVESNASQSGGNAVVSQPKHRIHVYLGAGPAFLPLFYPYGYSYWGYYGYSPFWEDAFWEPYFYSPYSTGFGFGYGKGQIKLKVEPKTAEVMIDNAYAGTVTSLKSSLWLRPGAYNLCVKAAGHSDFCRRIYVLSGKKLEILSNLAPGNGR